MLLRAETGTVREMLSQFVPPTPGKQQVRREDSRIPHVILAIRPDPAMPVGRAV
jgi:hypothetical protein